MSGPRLRAEIVFGPDHRITGIRHIWAFDEIYTAMAVQGLDTDRATAPTRRRSLPLSPRSISESLKEFDYFTFVHVGKDEKPEASS